MKTIKENITNEIVINKSKFITVLIVVNNEEECLKQLEMIKKKYKDATHYCYAYIIDNIKRFNDDKEPSGVAGMPMLTVLEKENLNHILSLVIRYFGGTKLGVGGLLRAYTSSIKECLNKACIITLIKGKRITISLSYDTMKKVDYILNDCKIINKEFKENIIYKADIKESNYIDIIKQLELLTDIKIIDEYNTYIEE